MAARTCNRCWNADLGGVEEFGERQRRGGDRGNLKEHTRRKGRGRGAAKTFSNLCV